MRADTIMPLALPDVALTIGSPPSVAIAGGDPSGVSPFSTLLRFECCFGEGIYMGDDDMGECGLEDRPRFSSPSKSSSCTLSPPAAARASAVSSSRRLTSCRTSAAGGVLSKDERTS